MLYCTSLGHKGRGVLSTKKIVRDTIIEQCPVIVIPEDEVDFLRATQLNNYFFYWGKSQQQAAIALGLGSIYNHSYTPNALYRISLDERMIEFVAIKNIAANEEITINYNGSPNDQSALWDHGGEWVK